MIKQRHVGSPGSMPGGRQMVAVGYFVAMTPVRVCSFYILGITDRFFSYGWLYGPIDVSMIAVNPIQNSLAVEQ